MVRFLDVFLGYVVYCACSVPPRIDAFVQPDDQILKQGIRTRLLCGVSQGDKPLDFTWEKDGRPLSRSGGGAAGGGGGNDAMAANARSDDVYPLMSNGLLWPLPAVTIRQVDADSSVLTFTNLSAVHSGRYQCSARNAAGVARQSAHLHVQGTVCQQSTGDEGAISRGR